MIFLHVLENYDGSGNAESCSIFTPYYLSMYTKQLFCKYVLHCSTHQSHIIFNFHGPTCQ